MHRLMVTGSESQTENSKNHKRPDSLQSLPDEVRNADSFDSFKRFLKTILFSRC